VEAKEMHVLLAIEISNIQKKIFEIRGTRVMLDRDLAELYGVQTKALNLAVKRNYTRFPPDFMFQLNKEELKNLGFQNETSSWGGTRYLPYAFTEHGVTMLASVLKSFTAIEVNINIVRAFIVLKQYQENYKLLARAIEDLELQTNRKIEDLNEAIEFLLSNHETARSLPKSRRRIGFKP
jgi:hypothetical protein